jgi:outer membrane protein OmpA-like peptidoglycan-associated protein
VDAITRVRSPAEPFNNRRRIFMFRPFALVTILATISLVSLPVQAAPDAKVMAFLAKDLPGAGDHPLVGRYKDSVLLARTEKAFDEIKLPSGPAEGKSYSSNKKFSSIVTAQGKVTRMIYVAQPGRSSLEVMTNIIDAVAARGLTPVFRCAGADCGESFVTLKVRWDRPETKVVGPNYEQLRKLLIDAAFDRLLDVRYALFKKIGPQGDTYVAIYGGLHTGGSFGTYSEALRDRVGVLVEVVEPRAMERRMEMVSAAEIGGSMAAQGKAVFYGILFDFDKADVKAESEPQLAEMAKFLKANASLRAFVIGHTDNKGALDYNMKLSSQRANAVVKALENRHGIDPKRLTSRGLGPLSPVTTNRSEDGRAKNRRVELVEQ